MKKAKASLIRHGLMRRAELGAERLTRWKSLSRVWHVWRNAASSSKNMLQKQHGTVVYRLTLLWQSQKILQKYIAIWKEMLKPVKLLSSSYLPRPPGLPSPSPNAPTISAFQ